MTLHAPDDMVAVTAFDDGVTTKNELQSFVKKMMTSINEANDRI